MTDIVQKLRLIDPNQVLLAAPPHDTSYLQAGLICHEAAAEIERLRGAVLAEREACAQIAETLWGEPNNGMATEEQAYGERCAAAIMARGGKP